MGGALAESNQTRSPRPAPTPVCYAWSATPHPMSTCVHDLFYNNKFYLSSHSFYFFPHILKTKCDHFGNSVVAVLAAISCDTPHTPHSTLCLFLRLWLQCDWPATMLDQQHVIVWMEAWMQLILFLFFLILIYHTKPCPNIYWGLPAIQEGFRAQDVKSKKHPTPLHHDAGGRWLILTAGKRERELWQPPPPPPPLNTHTPPLSLLLLPPIP